MTDFVKSSAVAILAGMMLAGCAATDLKAPCSSEEGKPGALAYAPDVSSPSLRGPALAAIAGNDRCGPMLPVNGSGQP